LFVLSPLRVSDLLSFERVEKVDFNAGERTEERMRKKKKKKKVSREKTQKHGQHTHCCRVKATMIKTSK
jgi:hypothetical protein